MAFALADNLGYDQFNLAGHDFGAIVSWNLAVQHPERLNTPIDWISSQNHGEDGLEQVYYGSSLLLERPYRFQLQFKRLMFAPLFSCIKETPPALIFSPEGFSFSRLVFGVSSMCGRFLQFLMRELHSKILTDHQGSNLGETKVTAELLLLH